MKKIIHLTALVILVGMACLCSAASSDQAPARVPRHVSISAPDPSLPEAAKSLLGKWVGKWNSRWGWDTTLYVEKIEGDSAQVVYAWGEYNTSKNSCHCNPNWVRVQKAKVTYSDDSVSLDFYTPKLRPRWLKASHLVTGSSDERYGESSHSWGLYTYSFVVEKTDPGTMKGHFVSAAQSHLRVEMKKTEPDKETDE